MSQGTQNVSLSDTYILPSAPTSHYLVLQSTLTVMGPSSEAEGTLVSLSEQNMSIDYVAIFLCLLSPFTRALQGQELSRPRIL